MSPDAFFCSVTAALLYGLPLPWRWEEDSRLHVAVPFPARAPRGAGVAGHKFMVEPRDVRLWGGLRLSTPELTWCELGSVLALPDLVAAGDRLLLVNAPLSTRDRIASQVDAYMGQRGRERVQRALRVLDGRAESPAESRLRVLLLQNGFREFELNHKVAVPHAGRSYRIDIAFLRQRVAIEYQGGYHANEAQWRADMTRISQLESIGWVVIQVNKDDLANPRELVVRIRRVLAAR